MKCYVSSMVILCSTCRNEEKEWIQLNYLIYAAMTQFKIRCNLRFFLRQICTPKISEFTNTKVTSSLRTSSSPHKTLSNDKYDAPREVYCERKLFYCPLQKRGQKQIFDVRALTVCSSTPVVVICCRQMALPISSTLIF